MCERNAGRSHMAGGSQGVHDLNMPNRGIVLGLRLRRNGIGILQRVN